MTKELDIDNLHSDLKSVNDASAYELAELVRHLRSQVSVMDTGHTEDGDDLLTTDEKELAHDAMAALQELSDELDERASRELVEDADIEAIAERLDGVHDLSGDVMHELEEVESTIDRTGWPNPNPYNVADESGYAAQEFAEDIRGLLTDDEDEGDAVADGGFDLILEDTIFENESPRVIDSNGTKYLVGWDGYGWFTVSHVELYPTDDDRHAVETVGETPHTSFTPDGARELLDAIEEGL